MILYVRLLKSILYVGGLFILAVAVLLLLEIFAKRPQVNVELLGSSSNYPINNIAWSHDGKKLAFVEEYGGIRVFDLGSGRQSWTNGIQGQGEAPILDHDVVLRRSVRWSEDDSLLFAHYEEGGTDFIEGSSGTTIHFAPDCYTLLNWNTDGTFICASKDGAEEKWTRNSWSKLSSFPARSGSPNQHPPEILDCSGDGLSVVSSALYPADVRQALQSYTPLERSRIARLYLALRIL
jgi:WD40 repeat protein